MGNLRLSLHVRLSKTGAVTGVTVSVRSCRQRQAPEVATVLIRKTINKIKLARLGCVRVRARERAPVRVANSRFCQVVHNRNNAAGMCAVLVLITSRSKLFSRSSLVKSEPTWLRLAGLTLETIKCFCCINIDRSIERAWEACRGKDGRILYVVGPTLWLPSGRPLDIGGYGWDCARGRTFV